ncbi:Der1-like family-domain-containing protein [Endogone sp. FLAS-F59071]|nr:Der1-like family-domain-containing protein [Endogone sp. FLAS-F59071]|eukprot:RUS17771.1 Der1-like family-domain-containing protein [Endogone sp. FLAS-F59071]
MFTLSDFVTARPILLYNAHLPRPLPPPPSPFATMNRQPQPRNELLDSFYSVPLITRTLVSATLVITVLGGLRLINPYHLVLVWPNVFKLQVWRLFTSFFFFPLGFPFLMNLYFIYRYSVELENIVFGNRTADYLFFVLFVMSLELIASYFLYLTVLGEALTLSLVYLWSQHFRDRTVTFMFGIQFKAIYLPWVLVAYDFLLGAGIPKASLVGIVAAHTYWYLESVYPAAGGLRLLSTPQLLYRWFPQGGPGRGGFATDRGVQVNPGRAAAEQAAPRYTWGRGQRLGS